MEGSEITEEWIGARVAAAELRLSTRQLLNLEEKGLPVRGERKTKRYPWPDVWAWYWYFRYLYRNQRQTEIPYLEPADAIAAYRKHCALSRAYWRIALPDSYRESDPLDPEAEKRLPEARLLFERGEIPVSTSELP